MPTPVRFTLAKLMLAIALLALIFELAREGPLVWWSALAFAGPLIGALLCHARGKNAFLGGIIVGAVVWAALFVFDEVSDYFRDSNRAFGVPLIEYVFKGTAHILGGLFVGGFLGGLVWRWAEVRRKSLDMRADLQPQILDASE